MDTHNEEPNSADPDGEARVGDTGGTRARSPFIDIAGTSRPRQVRRENEGCFLTATLERSLTLGPSSLALAEGVQLHRGPQGKLMVVADGITGVGYGAMASATSVQVLARYFTDTMPWLHDDDAAADDDEITAVIDRAFTRCQARLRAKLADRLPRGERDAPIGTTLTMAYIVWPHMYLAHVGDSRCYLLRERDLRQLTADHTLGARMVRRSIVPSEESVPAQLDNILVNTIGGASDDVDVEMHHRVLRPGDRLLLCSNGLARHVDERAIAQLLRDGVTAEEICRRLVEAATAEDEGDTITAVVAAIARDASHEPVHPDL